MKITRPEQLLPKIGLMQSPQELAEYLVDCCASEALEIELNDFIMLSIFTPKERKEIEANPNLLNLRRGTMYFGVAEMKNTKVKGLIFHSYETRDDGQGPDLTDPNIIDHCARFLRIEYETIVGIYKLTGEEPEWD